jgi:hypothetical protein
MAAELDKWASKGVMSPKICRAIAKLMAEEKNVKMDEFLGKNAKIDDWMASLPPRGQKLTYEALDELWKQNPKYVEQLHARMTIDMALLDRFYKNLVRMR